MKFLNKNIQKILKNQKGFTLAETIITVAIIAVLTGIVSVGIYGYLSTAYTTKVSETAKTIFYASQSYLLEQKQMGKLEEFNQSAQAYGDIISWDDLKEILEKNRGSEFDEVYYKENFSTDSTRYILMEKGSSSGNPLYQIVKAATNDNSLLSHTFLLEYDELTGVVRSVFYSEKTDRFEYNQSDSAMAEKDNVILRNPTSIHEKKQGYFGVDITGKKPASEVYLMEPANVTLFNGERLYLQWTDRNQSNPEFNIRPELLEELLYDITVYRQSDTGPETLVQFQDIGAEDISTDITLDMADDEILTGQGHRLAHSKNIAEQTNTYQLILDDIHHSIFQIYTSKNTALPANISVEKDVLAEDLLFCEVTVKLNKVATGLDATSLPASSNLQSSAFGGGEKEVMWADNSGTTQRVSANGSGVLEDGTTEKAFSIWNPRHLENVRYGKNIFENAHFIQSTSIDWEAAEGRNDKGIAYRSIVYYGEALAEQPFAGTYTVLKDNGGKYFPLKNLSIQQNDESMVGFVSQNMGIISGLTLEKPEVRGSLLTGIVAGVNGGTIEHITIRNGSVTGSHLLGGITGYNTAAGTIEDVTAQAKIDGITVLNQAKTITDIESFAAKTKGRYIGGLVGLNKGEAKKLTTQKSTVTGTSYVGGILGGNLAAAGIQIETLSNRNDLSLAPNASMSEELEYFGGLTGYQGESTLKGATNYGLLGIKRTSVITDGEKLRHIGGIAGYNTGTLDACVNESGSDRILEIQKDCIAQIKNGTLPTYLGKYVGGIAGTNTEQGTIKKCYNKNGAVLGHSVVGGFVGSNHGTDIVIQTDADMSGLVIGSKYLVGGIFGYNAGENVENYVNQSNVFGKGMVGGITGFNGKISGDYGEDKVLSYLNTLESKNGSERLSYLLEVENKLKASPSSKIESCENRGFVFAQSYFGGGLAGVNYGEIAKSNVVNNVSFPEITSLGKADCVGGIVGFNGSTGVIDGRKVTSQTVQMNIVANNFVGGIVGLNHGKISGYMQVEGTVYGKGDCVGGVIGLNTNANAISTLTNNATATIEGAYFVGGIMGCNVALSSGDNTYIKNVKSLGGNISAQAYVGGILGYNAYVTPGTTVGSLFDPLGELTVLKTNAYTGDPMLGELGNKTTIFEGCDSNANVSANRYVGGIIGYNSSRANLWVVSSNNGGVIKINAGSKVDKATDGSTYYYIGGITGRNSQGGIIHKCNNNGSVKSPSTYLGGICEVNEGYVQFCGSGKNEGTGTEFGTEGENSVGGITGLNRKGAYVVSCYADSYAKIKGGNKTGGLVGTNEKEGVITSNYYGNEAKSVAGLETGNNPTGEEALSYCSATVIGADDTGGIVGYNQGNIAHIIVKPKANITGIKNVGGFVGSNAKDASVSGKSGTIENLVNYAKVYGSHEVGGIVGKHNATKIINCDNRGEVKAIGERFGYAGGITGSNEKDVTIEDCSNYGLVRSEHSFAGGITGINDGTLRTSDNYGSVQGSFEGTSVSTSGDGVLGAAIGGVAGCNYRNGKIYDCASKDSGDNKIQGNYIVGGIIGYYDRDSRYNGEFLNKTADSLNVDITIEPANQKVEVDGRCRIGGVIGITDYSPRDTILKDFTFTGTIHVLEKAGGNEQDIGGIIGWQAPNITLENCTFDGKISGYGNNPNDHSNAGIGGLAGTSNGSILVQEDKEGRYTSSTKRAFIEGAKRVGGVVGETSGAFNVKLKTKDGTVLLNEVNDTIYYENHATVKGGMWVGGFYGSVEHEQKTLKNLKNNGLILSRNINGLSSMGGICGAAKTTEITNCVNTGDLGDAEDKNVIHNVGGLVGYCDGGTNKVKISNSHNTGDIYAGKSNIGGLFGTLKNAEVSYNCTSRANIEVNQSNVSQVTGVGGIIGRAGKVQIVNDTGSLQNMITDSENVSISIWGRASQIGGMIGRVEDSDMVSMEKMLNTLRIYEKSTKNSNQNQVVQTGGFVGLATGNGEILLDGCTNRADIEMKAGKEVGGLVGKAENRTITINNSTNEGSLYGSDCVGGMVAFASGGTIAGFSGNINKGILNGRIAVGGIAGYIKGMQGTVEECLNEGLISADTVSGGTAARNIGGCFGILEKSGLTNPLQIVECINNGTVSVNQAKVFSDMSNIGGIVGYLKGDGSLVNHSQNNGMVTLTASEKGNQRAVAIGGIVGRVSHKAMVGQNDSKDKRTINTGDVLITGGVNDNVSQIGGIAGLVESEGRLMYCTNRADVTANQNSSANIGGVAGKSSGAVYSCRAEGIKVEGRTGVGGLVGNASSYASKVTSVGANDGTKGYDLSFVSASVQGQERVGGVVGYLQEGTVYNVYVKSDSEIILDRVGAETKEKAAGGIVGYAGSLGNTLEAKGIVSSCYNFGTVKDTESAGAKYYLGGLIGYRQHLPGKAAANIVDSFNFYRGNIEETIPPNSEGLEGTISKMAWMVGNEPYTMKDGVGYIYQDSADEQTYTPGNTNPLETSAKFCWSQEACEALRVSLGIENSVYPYDSQEAIFEIMENYDGFKLPSPELISIVPGKGFDYTYTLKALPGFYTEYGFRVYDGNHEIGKLIPQNAVHTGIGGKKGDGTNIIYDFQKEFTLNLETMLTKEKLNDLVGKTLSVTTYAKGYSPDDLNYSKESDEIVLLQMVVMPPLPEPILKSIAPTINEVDWFDAEGRQVKTKLEITNWAEYQKAADLVYANLSAVKDNDAVLFEADLFDRFVNGLIQFEMADTFVDSETADLSNIRINHVIPFKDDLNPQKVNYEVVGDKAYVNIDYTDNTVFDSNSGNRPWHAYQISARIKDGARGITIDPNNGNFKYRYTDSLERKGTNFRLKTILKPPKNIKTEYVGKRDPNDLENPLAYLLKWEKDGGLDSTIRGYKVELEQLKITDDQGNTEIKSFADRTLYGGPPYVTETLGAGATELKMTKEQLLQIFTDLQLEPPEWWGDTNQYTIEYKVTTLSKDETVCITSEKSQISEFPLIKQQPEVTDITAQKDALGENMKIGWTDIPQTEKERHNYDVSYQISLNNEVLQEGTNTITGALEWDGIILYPQLKDKAFEVVVQVVKQGEEGTDPGKVSLNSNVTEKAIIIGDRLEIPIDFKVRGDKTEEVDGVDSLFLHVTWAHTGNTGTDGVKPITEENCSGYQIDIVIDGKEEAPITTIVDGCDTLETDIVIPVTKGSTIKFGIRALGNGSAEKSEWVSISSEFSQTSMAEPDMTIDPDETTSFTRNDYPSGESYELTIDVKEGGVTVAGQKIEILYKGEQLREYTTSIKSGTGTSMVSLDPVDGEAIELAGQEVVIRLSNMSEDIKSVLPSKAKEFTITMPKIKLDSPDPVLAKSEVTQVLPPGSLDTPEVYNLYHAQIDVYGTVGESDTEILEEEGNARKGQEIKLYYQDGTDWKEGSFILMKPSSEGNSFEPVDGTEITSFETKEEEQVEFYFRLPKGFQGNEDSYKLVVVNRADTDHIKYDDSEEAEVSFSSANEISILTLDLPEILPDELLPIPEEESTTEESTIEEGTTEESTTQEGTTEESTTQEGTTEESTTQEGTTEPDTSQESTVENNTTEDAAEESSEEESAAETSTATQEENQTE